MTTGTWTGTCVGNQIGTATGAIMGSTANGTFLGGDASGDACNLSSSTELLTAGDGSTLKLKTTGLFCGGSLNGYYGVRHDAYQITGGTGRFAGATGAGTLTVTIGVFVNGTVKQFPVHIEGNIIYAK